jgi:peptidoglycan/LPS O-acetylase OafA/YrhL
MDIKKEKEKKKKKEKRKKKKEKRKKKKVLPQIQMLRHLLVLWSALSHIGCQGSPESPTPLPSLHY